MTECRDDPDEFATQELFVVPAFPDRPGGHLVVVPQDRCVVGTHSYERHTYTRFAALVLGLVLLSEPWRPPGPPWLSWSIWGLVLALWAPVVWAAYLDKYTTTQEDLHSEAHGATRNRFQLNFAGQGPDETEVTAPLPVCDPRSRGVPVTSSPTTDREGRRA